jgi:ATP-dependent DNA helicase PIF1
MDFKLSDEQEFLFKVMEETKQHMFVTGRAGSGKSVLLRHFREQTKKKVVVAAPTGIAALNVRGQTLHSLFKLPPQLHRKGSLSPNTRLNSLLKRIDCLVIDEISMVRADIMDAIDERLREARNNDSAFGGVQVIMFGDVYQLPPVVEEELHQFFEAVHGGYFFFNAHVWGEADFKIYELTQVFRQKDPVFKEILNAVRDGSVVDSQIEQLNARHDISVPSEGTVTLAPTNALVTEINQRRLDQLKGKARHYTAVITGVMKKSVFPTEENLQLKKDAQVVLLKNDKDGRWVNGSVGMIEGLFDNHIDVRVGGIVYTLDRETWEEIVYTYDQDTHKVEAKIASSFTQYPIRLAWALTIHKSQGQTYESVALDLTTATFAPGQLYVALSRCTSLEGLYLKMPVKRSHIIVEPKVTAFMLRQETIKVEVQPEEGQVIAVVESEQTKALAVLDIRHDEINISSVAAQNLEIQKVFDHDEIEGKIINAGVTNAKREKIGRTKKEKKSTKGRKTKSGVLREPLQLSLDIRTIRALNAMGINKSQLFEELLQQYKPFLEKYTTINPVKLDHDEIEKEE